LSAAGHTVPIAPLPVPNATARPATASTSTAMVTLLSLLLFLLVNPFIALLFMTIVSLFTRVPPWSFLIPATIAFTIFFYSREYGIEWYTGSSTDDVPSYIAMYESNYGLPWRDIWIRFLILPSGNEPLWHIPWWVLINTLDPGENTFIFLHYMVIFLVLFLALKSLSTRFLLPFVLVYFFLTPTSIDGLAHIWRQELASFVFLAGVGLYVVQHKRIGKWIIYLSPLFHMSNLFLIVVFMLYQFLRKRGAFNNKLKFMIVLMLVLATIPAIARVGVVALDYLGMVRVMSYFEGSGTDEVRVYMLIAVYAVPQLVAFALLRNDNLNRVFMLLCFAVFSIVLALPAANGIYDRLLMFTLPLWGLFMFRCLLLNFSSIWRLPVLIAIFIVGAVRLHAPVAENSGPGYFLAFGHAFDPTMGIVRMLTSLDDVH
jgi:EpsG family